MKASEFEYDLSESRIAARPLFRRDSSRLMFVDRVRGVIEHRRFKEVERFLAPGDLLVLNDTRVSPLRLLGQKSSGGAIELLLCRELEGGAWLALGRSNRPFGRGQTLLLDGGVRVDVEGVEAGGFVVVRFPDDIDVLEFCNRCGHTPLPPYIRRPRLPSDSERYQTVFARHPASCAAPTAGLHFTHKLLRRLALAGVRIAYITLQVGPGTFRPIRAENVEEHTLEPEPYTMPLETVLEIYRARFLKRRVVACGTTVARALESWAKTGKLKGLTDLYIYPGFEFQMVDALVTNFHLPRSSLLLLVCAFAGKGLTLQAYREAIDRGYRFYSYGDAMIVV